MITRGPGTFAVVLAVSVLGKLTTSSGLTACDVQCSSSMNNTRTAKFCESEEQFALKGRCCYNLTASANETSENVVGVDLHNCSLTNTNVTGLFKGMTAVVVISLEENPLTELYVEDFYHLTNLYNLTLPVLKVNGSAQCPGGEEAWNSVEVVDKVLLCQNQTNTCHNMENNGTCPKVQSYCVPAGPGQVDCLCSPGYHGYKCLRQGTFPTAAFAGGLGGCTLALAAGLWITQRRHVKKNK